MREHGGNIHRASQKTGIPMSKMIDFSASINPLGVPDTVAQVIQENIPFLIHYPEPFAESLAAHLANYLHVDPQTILCGNGSTELIYLVARALAPKRVLIPAPTFSEYERACSMSGNAVCVRYDLSRKNNFDIDRDRFIAAMAGCDMAFLCNPNNPTGRLMDRDAVIAIAQAAQRRSCYLIVDEAFIDFVPEHSVVHEVAKRSHLIVLRSLTKYFALSGLRIGYGVFPLALVSRMKSFKEPWTINSLASKAAIAALDDRSYQEKTAIVFKQEKKHLEDGLDLLQIERIPSLANYCLIKMQNAQKVIDALKKKGMLVRDCANFTGLDETYIRIAVRSYEENASLLKELAALCAA